MAKYGLCIGINDYPGTDSDLSGCVNDAHDWAGALTARGFAVKQLLDKQATGKAMRESISGVVGRAKQGDTVVVQYSAHGSYAPDEDGDEPDGTDECLCPWGASSKGQITVDEMVDLYSAKAGGVKVVVISDFYHSGRVTRFVPIVTPATTPGANPTRRRVGLPPQQSFLAKRAATKLRVRRTAWMWRRHESDFDSREHRCARAELPQRWKGEGEPAHA